MALSSQDAAQRGARYHHPPGAGSEGAFLLLAHAQLGSLQRLDHERRVADATFAPPPLAQTSHALVALDGSWAGHDENAAGVHAWPPPPMFASNALETAHYAACRAPPPPPALCLAINKGDGMPVTKPTWSLLYLSSPWAHQRISS
jgi:hypothetical protein